MKLSSEEQGERIGWSVKKWNRLNFVTATLAEPEGDPRVISKRWYHFIKNLRHLYPTLRVIRVLQKHPGGHGWHVHALMDRYISSHELLHQAELAGLGRMDFQMVSGERRRDVVGYVTRYVTRDLKKRDKSMRHVRLLTASGHLRCAVRWWVRYVDLTVETSLAAVRRSMLGILEVMGVRLHPGVSSVILFGNAPPAALAELRRLHPQLCY